MGVSYLTLLGTWVSRGWCIFPDFHEQNIHILLMHTVQVRPLIVAGFGLGRGLGFFHRSVGLSVGKEFLLLFFWIVFRTHKNFEALPSWLCSIVLIFWGKCKDFFLLWVCSHWVPRGTIFKIWRVTKF